MVNTTETARCYGVILAGGRGSRMGNVSKPLLSLGSGRLIDAIISRAGPQVDGLCLSVNHNQALYSDLGLPVVADGKYAYKGPLCGIASAMDWLVSEQGITANNGLLACFPGDVPWFPENIVAQLKSRLIEEQSGVALVEADGQLQPLFSVWRLTLLPQLRQALAEGLYGPRLLLPRLSHSIVKITSSSEGEFLNINTVNELKLAQKLSKQP